MKYISLLSNLDILGNPIQFKIRGNEKYKTTFGGGLSIILSSLVLLLGINLLKELSNRSNPAVSLSTSITSQLKINLKNRLPLMFYVSDSSGNPLEQVQYLYDITGYIFSYNGSNTTTPPKVYYLNFTVCSVEFIQNNYGNYSNLFLSQLTPQNFKSNLLCLNPPNDDVDYSIINSYGSYAFQYVQFILAKCNNKTMNNTCKSVEVINQILSTAQLTMITPDTYFDNLNYNSPGLPYINFQTFIISSNLYKRYFIYLKSVNYLSDNGILLSDVNNNTYFQIDKLTQEINLSGVQTRVPNTLVSICFTIQTNILNIYSRHYLGITQILANLGGAFNALMILCLIINYYVEQSLKQIEIFDMCCTKSLLKKNNQPTSLINNQAEIKTMNNYVNQSKTENTFEKIKDRNDYLNIEKKQENNIFELSRKSIIFEYPGIEKLLEIKFNFFQKIIGVFRTKKQKEKKFLAGKFYDEIFDISFVLGNLLENQLFSSLLSKK